ncbi:MAG: trehalose-phosphatase [Aeromicrobium sp.]
MPKKFAARDSVLADPEGTLLALDFDGTLAHIVEDPTEAFAHEHSIAALGRIGPRLGHIAIITGRPVHQALELGGFSGVPGLERLVIFGQYGRERWDAATGEIVSPPNDPQIAIVEELLPQWLADHQAAAVRIEDKGLAIALHTRGLGKGVFERISPELSALAAEYGLDVEPGRQVVELRTAVIDKGDVLRAYVAEIGARHVIFAGDDLGDVPAFEAVGVLRAEGITGLLICSASAEQDALVSLSDLVLDGPDAVATWLEELADDL